jgi:hypothetical protein
MVIGNSKRLKSGLLIIICGVLAFACAKYLTAKLLTVRSPAEQSQGFDFDYILNNTKVETGPFVGDRIDLENLKGPDGKSLAASIAEQPAVIVAVNSGCGMCRTSADEMSEIRKRLKPAGIEYYLVSFAPSANPADFFAFAYSLNTGAPAFSRSTGEGNPPKRFTDMLTPSHFLVGRSGLVISKWPGSSNAELVRHRMANQIVTDTLTALSAVSPPQSR